MCTNGLLQSYNAKTGVVTTAMCSDPTNPIVTVTGCYPNKCCTAPGFTGGHAYSYVDSCPPGATLLSRIPISDLSSSKFPYTGVGILIGGIATGAAAYYVINKYRNMQAYEEVKELVPKKYATSTESI